MMNHVLFVTAQVNDILALMPYATYRHLQFEVVSSIQDALAQLINHKDIEVIITDSQLADGLGIDLLAKANARRVYLVVPPETPLNAVRPAGIYGLLKNPVDIPALESIFHESKGESSMVAAPPLCYRM